MTRSLLALHGGSVEARSEGAGKGSEFILRIPICEEYRREETPEPVANLRATPRRSILVVEDNRDSADTLCLLLESKGHEVRVANDGPGALEAVRDFSPEVVILDIGLPGLDGYHVARKLSSMPHMRKARLIALTGYGQPEDRRVALDAGFDEHLVKPLAPEALEKVVG